jgi:lipoprotein-releasing system ATP-binding protein
VLIELEGLRKVYDHRGGELEVLAGLDLTIRRGDMVAIMGSSGAGKSTLLQILGTLDTPTSGSYLFEGKEVFSGGAATLAKFRNEQIGFVFQFHHLLPEFTALENVMMPGLIGRMKRQDAEGRGVELLKMVGLGDRLRHQPGELSGGEQQRVAIARALFMRPRLLLADEPTGNLDLKTSSGIHEILRELNERMGITILVVTHDPRLAEQMPIQLLVDGGKIIPYHQGDERARGRVSDTMLHASPSTARPFLGDDLGRERSEE